MFKYILFDLDGTLTDPQEGITKSFQYALRAFGIDIEDLSLLRRHIGPPIRDSLREYGFSDDTVEEVLAKYRERFGTLGIFENSMYDGIPKLLRELRAAGKTLLVATSKPTDYAVPTLEHFGIAQYFDVIAGANMDGSRSVKSEVITYALESAGVSDISECVMVGDREHDIIGARAFGMRSVGVLYGYGDELELRAAGADFIAARVEDLYGILV